MNGVPGENLRHGVLNASNQSWLGGLERESVDCPTVKPHQRKFCWASTHFRSLHTTRVHPSTSAARVANVTREPPKAILALLLLSFFPVQSQLFTADQFLSLRSASFEVSERNPARGVADLPLFAVLTFSVQPHLLLRKCDGRPYNAIRRNTPQGPGMKRPLSPQNNATNI